MNSNPKHCEKTKKKNNEKDSLFIARIRGPALENRNIYLKWTEEENRLYLEFLRENLDEHDSVAGRRPAGYFTKMS